MIRIHKLSLIIFILVGVIISSVGKSEEIFHPSNNEELNQIISAQVAETFEFSGMALYLNQVSFFSYNNEKLIQLNNEHFADESAAIENVIVVGRYNAMVIELNGGSFRVNSGQLKIDDLSAAVTGVKIYQKNELVDLKPAFKSIRYHHLWWPLAQLSKFFEFVLVLLGNLVNQYWGLAIILFAILIKIVFIPLSIVTNRVQSKVNGIQGILEPELKSIKANFDGEQAHLKIMAAHKKLGVSPFYTMKPLLMTLIQIPFLIAIFNTLGEMSELKGASFLWVADLSLPDMVFILGQNIPMFGEWFNLLPFIMAGISMLATIGFGDEKLPENIVKNQRMRLYLMALVFFVLFYPFPAVMVLYWALANLIQNIFRKL